MALTRAFHNQIITKTYVSYFWSLIQFQNFTAVYGLNQTYGQRLEKLRTYMKNNIAKIVD